jgi:DNA-binding Lrp family transcriptional regulator
MRDTQNSSELSSYYLEKPLMNRTDVRILTELQNNSRISNKSLAAAVELAPSSCFERVRRLQESGVIRGTHADIEPAALGIGIEAMYFIGLTRHSRDLVEAFRADILAMPEVRAVYLVAGPFDFLVHVAVRGTRHLRDLAFDAFTTRPEVARIETVLVFDHDRKFVLPDYTGSIS